ncbi:MAG TPA: adenylate cyclase regulatory domain-containing protein [Thermoleophilaceae bacterium]
MGIDFEAEGLLDGLEEDRQREARLELLRELERDGVRLDELRSAVRENRLVLLPAELTLGGDERLTLTEVVERSGLDADFFSRLWRALGFAVPRPDEPTFSEDDVEAAANVRRFRQAGMPDEAVLEIGRLLGQSMARVAAATSRVFAETFLQPGDTERDLGLRYAEQTRALEPLLAEAVLHALRAHERANLRQAAVGSAELRSGRLPGALEMAICFADLVGFTKLGEDIAADELGDLAERFAVMALEVAEAPVRLVKTIGDAAMLVAPEVDPLIDAALRLLELAEGAGASFPRVHAGLDAGPVLPRAGDFYGSPVNLASRITDFALPGSVVVSAAAREASARDWAWSTVGRRRLRGVREPAPLFRVRREAPERP